MVNAKVANDDNISNWKYPWATCGELGLFWVPSYHFKVIKGPRQVDNKVGLEPCRQFAQLWKYL